jgi:hypothetical protein
LLYCLNFAGVSGNTLTTDYVSQVLQLLLSERAFALLDRQLVLLQDGENLLKMCHMI